MSYNVLLVVQHHHTCSILVHSTPLLFPINQMDQETSVSSPAYSALTSSSPGTLHWQEWRSAQMIKPTMRGLSVGTQLVALLELWFPLILIFRSIGNTFPSTVDRKPKSHLHWAIGLSVPVKESMTLLCFHPISIEDDLINFHSFHTQQ